MGISPPCAIRARLVCTGHLIGEQSQRQEQEPSAGLTPYYHEQDDDNERHRDRWGTVDVSQDPAIVQGGGGMK